MDNQTVVELPESVVVKPTTGIISLSMTFKSFIRLYPEHWPWTVSCASLISGESPA